MISSVIVSRYCIVGFCSVLVAAGCTFSPPNLGPDDPPTDGRPPDDSRPGEDARLPDAREACEGEELRLELRIGGQVATEGGGPYVEALIGDLVEISAAGSCAGSGEISYDWSFSPEEGIAATAAPTLASGPETFTVYATAAGSYTVTLTASAMGGAIQQTRAVTAIRAHAWQAAEVDGALGMGQVRDLSVGGGNLWIAAQGGPYSLPLAGPMNAFARVEHTGEDQIPAELQVVLFDERTDLLWFGRRSSDDGLYQLDMAVTPPASDQIDFDGEDALNGNADTRDIVAVGTNTIAITTSRGITAVDEGEDEFSGRIQPEGDNPAALVVANGRRMAGGRQLYDLENSAVFDLGVGGAMGSKISAMASDDESQVLWIGTNGEGVFTFDLRSNMVLEHFTDGDGGDLASDVIRALLIESAGPHEGDVWAATNQGVSRYISRRKTWLHMNEDHGLGGHVDLFSIAIDTSDNRRVLYAGSSTGVVYIRVP